jgi:hypothetical protein
MLPQNHVGFLGRSAEQVSEIGGMGLGFVLQYGDAFAKHSRPFARNGLL